MNLCTRRAFLVQSAAFSFLVASGSRSPARGASPSGDFRFDESWPNLVSELYPERCQISGVAVAKDGSILALSRGDNPWISKGFRKELIQGPTVLVIDPQSGKIVRGWGQSIFMMPHQIDVDRDGNIWISDVGLNRIFKFDANGKKLMELGGKEINFNMPTDVGFFRDGSFAVSDGYGNKRVVKFDSAGQQVASWGKAGTEPLQFHTPHSVAVDDQDRLYVADRENHRIQVLSAQGELLAIWNNVERPLSVRFAAGSLFVLSNLEAEKGIVRRLNPGGEVLESFYTRPPGTTEDFAAPHGLAVTADAQTLYVAFAGAGRRLQRYRRA